MEDTGGNRAALGLLKLQGSWTKITQGVSEGFGLRLQRNAYTVAIRHTVGCEIFIPLNLYLLRKV